MRDYHFKDQLIKRFDRTLKIFLKNHALLIAPNPAAAIPESALSTQERRHVGGLMRVNHTGEICAQALYQGQALTAHSAEVRQTMQQAAEEETYHLHWCKQRLEELAAHASYLNPLWYLGALILGTMAGFIGDRWSLGFLAETEQQVVNHLNRHLQLLPQQDEKSRAILCKMLEDEAQHAKTAAAAGAAELSPLVKNFMHFFSKIMTTVAYWI